LNSFAAIWSQNFLVLAEKKILNLKKIVNKNRKTGPSLCVVIIWGLNFIIVVDKKLARDWL